MKIMMSILIGDSSVLGTIYDEVVRSRALLFQLFIMKYLLPLLLLKKKKKTTHLCIAIEMKAVDKHLTRTHLHL